MAKIGKLKAALAAHKGVDYEKERQKRLQKKAGKASRKQARQEEELDVADTEVLEDEPDEGGVKIDISIIDETSSSESDGFGDDSEDAGNGFDHVEATGDVSLPTGNGVSLDEDGDAEEDEADDDIPYSDIASLNSDEKGDVTPYQRLTINNHAALNAALARIQLPLPKLPFSAHQSITSAEPVEIKDVEDDLSRELQFYAQSLAAVKEGRRLLKLEGVPFSRPNDYFAEMVKSEDHMGRVKKKLIDEAASKRAASDARRQRDLKKFGKAVQVAKLQERDKAKKDSLDRINVLKRKRSNGLPTAEKEPDLFDIELEKESKSHTSSKRDSKSAPNSKRQKKNEKYGFGGKKKFSKSGDAHSTSDLRDFSVKKMKGGFAPKKRLGKSRRANARS